MQSHRLSARPPTVSLEGLDPDHYQPLVGAIRHVLSTELAELTLAELIDGLPLIYTMWDMRGRQVFSGHPLGDHKHLCDGAVESAKKFRDAIDPAVFCFDARVIQSYQNAPAGSREFQMRLVELVAVSVHQTGVLLFQSEPKMHSKDEIDSVISAKMGPIWDTLDDGRRVPIPFKEIEPHPTLFFHVDYMHPDRYTHGLADVAGYWAEDRILGGIVLFDRGKSKIECNDIYFHSGRLKATCRVWRLLPAQFDDLVGFLLSADSSRPPPFPILASSTNRHRYDAWDAIARHNIFRDPRERKYSSKKPKEWRDVRSATDYPEIGDMVEKLEAAAQAQPGSEIITTTSVDQGLASEIDDMAEKFGAAAQAQPGSEATTTASVEQGLASSLHKGDSEVGQDVNQHHRFAGDTGTRRDSVSSHGRDSASSSDSNMPQTPPPSSEIHRVKGTGEPTALGTSLREEEHGVLMQSQEETRGDSLAIG